MAYIGRQISSSTFLKLDSIQPLFNGNRVTFPLTLGGEAFFPGNPFSLLVSLSGVIQEPLLKRLIYMEGRWQFVPEVL